MNFVFQIKLKRYIYFAKYDCCFGNSCVHFEPLLGWECAYVCHNIRTEKESTYGKNSEQKTSNWHTSEFHHGREASKKTFFSKKHRLLGNLCAHFEPLLGWGYAYVCHD